MLLGVQVAVEGEGWMAIAIDLFYHGIFLNVRIAYSETSS